MRIYLKNLSSLSWWCNYL